MANDNMRKNEFKLRQKERNVILTEEQKEKIRSVLKDFKNDSRVKKYLCTVYGISYAQLKNIRDKR